MVKCENEDGFTLGGEDAGAEPESGGTGRGGRRASVASALYKRHVDALFEGAAAARPRSAEPLDKVKGADAVSGDDDDYCRSRIHSMSNAVQMKIQRMFAELADEATPAESAPPTVFAVHYLGRAPLDRKITSLAGLQAPLRDLYLAHCRAPRRRTPPAHLEISGGGLRVSDGPDRDRLNAFPTIAVWSAVKFVVQPLDATESSGAILGCAFLPLISDPEAVDRQALFRPLSPTESRVLLDAGAGPPRPEPLFAVVMRRTGVARRLDCHAFLCRNNEDAIVIAATLYKALMAHMSRHDAPRRPRLHNRHGVSRMSIASSVEPPTRPPRLRRPASSLSCDSDRADGFSVTESFVEKSEKTRSERASSERFVRSPPPAEPGTAPPSADPRRVTLHEVKAKLETIKGPDTSGSDTIPSKKSSDSIESTRARAGRAPAGEASVRSKVSEKIELFRQLERRRTVTRPPSPPPPVPAAPPAPAAAPPAHAPLRRSHSGRQSLSEAGDILTKVAIPRSGSFLNAGGLTRYKSIGHRNNGKKGGGSPLGFNELFNEFKVQENLHSMDEILNAIIDAEGMSFNDLKPIYKEFLLKLAVTLTKDEIFQHSKAIMKKQKKKISRRHSIFQSKRRKIFKSASGLRMVFNLPFGKELWKREKSRRLSSSDFHVTANDKKLPASESSVSTSSYDLKQFSPKKAVPPACGPQSERHRAERAAHATSKVLKVGERTSSEDSDFLTLSNRLGCQNRNSSSGYVSCSECESESCIDRCYCSLKGQRVGRCRCAVKPYEHGAHPDVRPASALKPCKECYRSCFSERYDPEEPSWCSCDSESCAESTRCYCGPLRHRWSSSSMVAAVGVGGGGGGAGEDRPRRNSASVLEYEAAARGRQRDAAAARRTTRLLTVRSASGVSGSQQALSAKKSAEMAALFADVRLSQRGGGVRALLPRPRARPPLSRNASLEDTLGYLP